MRIGAHMSIAGGVSKAVDRAVLHNCEALQIFTKNASQWDAAPLVPDEVRAFRRGVEKAELTPVVSHASYLINLATAVPKLRAQSINTFIDELDRADSLGLLGVVIHPGTCTSGTEDEGLHRIAQAIRQALQKRPNLNTMVLLEHTAGQGRTLGYKFEHLATILKELNGSPKIGICLDTCHLLAAGYDIASASGYQKTFSSFKKLIGIDRLRVFHGNDSKKPCGSRVDRHQHIGDGFLGLEPFKHLLTDQNFSHLAMLIETEKTKNWERGKISTPDPLDERNLNTLKSLRDT